MGTKQRINKLKNRVRPAIVNQSEIIIYTRGSNGEMLRCEGGVNLPFVEPESSDEKITLLLPDNGRG